MQVRQQQEATNERRKREKHDAKQVARELKDGAKRRAALTAAAAARAAEWDKELAALMADGAHSRETQDAVAAMQAMKHLSAASSWQSKESSQHEEAQKVSIVEMHRLVESAGRTMNASIPLKQFRYGADGRPFFQQG